LGKRVRSNLLDYKIPKYLIPFRPNRFVTLFLYLNDVKEGGETVFPHSSTKMSDNITRTGMDECSNGLATPARKLHASLFYVQGTDMMPDLFSRHGGCPPEEGTKWGSNQFMWNADASESTELYL